MTDNSTHTPWYIEYTPGPWIYKRDGFDITIGNESTRHAYLANDRTVAVIHDNSMVAEANAALIASAPDLLAVAEGCLGYFDYMASQDSDFTPDPAWLAPLRAAIEKARKGQSS